MITQQQRLVVNEFESLEAMCDASGQLQPDGCKAPATTDNEMTEFRKTYWRQRIEDLIDKFNEVTQRE